MSWKRIWRVVFSVIIANLGWLAGAALPVHMLGPVLSIAVLVVLATVLAIVDDYCTHGRKPLLGVAVFVAQTIIFTVAMLLAWAVRATID